MNTTTSDTRTKIRSVAKMTRQQNHDPVDSPYVVDLFTDEEWIDFYKRGHEHAEAAGGVFILDESAQLISQRAWARYLKSVMTAVGVETLAARIVPEDYPADYE